MLARLATSSPEPRARMPKQASPAYPERDPHRGAAASRAAVIAAYREAVKVRVSIGSLLRSSYGECASKSEPGALAARRALMIEPQTTLPTPTTANG